MAEVRKTGQNKGRYCKQEPQEITYCSKAYLFKENDSLNSSSLSKSGLVPLPGKFRADELREAEGTGTGDKVYFVKGQT